MSTIKNSFALDAVAAGASGFLLKDARSAELAAAIRAVAHGDSVIAPNATRLLLRLHAVILRVNSGFGEWRGPVGGGFGFCGPGFV